MISFSTFDDLDSKLQTLLHQNDFDMALHLAAVSDYSVEWVDVDHRRFKPAEIGKINSDSDLRLILKKNPKIICRIKTYAKNKELMVVAFKLTNTILESEWADAVSKLSVQSDIDYVIHNDLHFIDDHAHSFRIFSSDEIIQIGKTKKEMAESISELARKFVNGRIKCS